jgi:hypothetical protein
MPDAERADAELSAFKDKVISRSKNVTEYDCRFDRSVISTELLSEGAEAAQGRLTDFSVGGKPLRELILENLKAEIEKEYPAEAAAAQSALETGLEQQELFVARSRRATYREGATLERWSPISQTPERASSYSRRRRVSARLCCFQTLQIDSETAAKK